MVMSGRLEPAPGHAGATSRRGARRSTPEVVDVWPRCRATLSSGLLPEPAARLDRPASTARAASHRRPGGGRMIGLLAQLLRGARRLADDTCRHQPRCPDALAVDRAGARAVASHPEQGWSLLCNGVNSFDDGGVLLPGGRAVAPLPTYGNVVLTAALARAAVVSGERMMARNVTARARENREYVRSLLRTRQPEFAAAVEAAVGALASVMSGRGLHRDIRLHRHPCTCRLTTTTTTTTTRSGSASSPGCGRGAGRAEASSGWGKLCSRHAAGACRSPRAGPRSFSGRGRLCSGRRLRLRPVIA